MRKQEGEAALPGNARMAAEAFAPAKINLTLHVTGRRDDGYHLLDSLVVFADVGDRLTVAPAETLSLRVTGPRAAGVPTGADNLVLRAARALAPDHGAAITLDKRLPAASGIGGGSADAAAAVRALAALWHLPPPDPATLIALGADVPVCLASRPARMSGLGEALAPCPALPPFHLVLANPGVAVSTPAVFRALARPENPPMPATLPPWPDAAALAAWLATMRNDLETPATALCPAIHGVLVALAARPGCLLARMSGSGATCFGLFADPAAAAAAARALETAQPDWWVANTAPRPLG